MNAKKLNLLLQIFKITLITVGVVLSILVWGGPAVTDSKAVLEKFRESTEMNAAMYFLFFILILGILVILGFFLLQLILSPKKTVLSIIGIFISLIVYMIFFFAGTTDNTDTLALKNPVSDGVVLSTTAGLYTIGVCLLVGLIVIIAGPFMGRLRK